LLICSLGVSLYTNPSYTPKQTLVNLLPAAIFGGHSAMT